MLTLLLQNTLMDMLSDTRVITAILLAAVGLALTFLSKKITRMVRKKQKIDDHDKIYVGLKALSLLLILIALIIIALKK